MYHFSKGNTPFIASIPHSGLQVPEDLPDLAKLPNHDWHIDKLYEFLPSIGVTTLKANYSRYVVDLNRSLTTPLFGSFYKSVIAETDSHGNTIYESRPSNLHDRITKYYDPYHRKLGQLLSDTVSHFGYAILIDLHAFAGGADADIVLGNVDDSTCSKELSDIFMTAYGAHFNVSKNEKYVGGHIVRTHSSKDIQAIQIEHRYDIYLDELNPDTLKFNKAQDMLKDAFLRMIWLFNEAQNK